METDWLVWMAGIGYIVMGAIAQIMGERFEGVVLVGIALLIFKR